MSAVKPIGKNCAVELSYKGELQNGYMPMPNGNVKILMNWDIKPGLDQEYFEFVMREWVPNTTKLGLTPIEAWYNVYARADIPRIMAGAIADDEASMREIISSTDWADLQAKLMEYVENYSHKIVRVTGDYQL